jgi:hypothetical protein
LPFKKVLLWSFLSSLTRLDKVGMCFLCIPQAVTTLQIVSRAEVGNKWRTNWVEPGSLARD